MYQSSPLQVKIFHIIVAVLGILSVLSIIGNMISAFPLGINIKWIILILISGFYFLFWKHRYATEVFQAIFLGVIIFFFIPYGWIDSGGSNNNTLAYVFLTMISITYLFRGPLRLTYILSLIGVFISMYLLEFYYPELLRTYSASSQFIDRLIQIPLTLTSGFLLIRAFTTEQDSEKHKIQQYSDRLAGANKQLQYLADHDSLTHCYNRRAFDTIVQDQINKQIHFHIILLDVDHFKSINDVLGHSAGDQCLIRLVARLIDVFPQDTCISRWGGDEFAMVYYQGSESLTRDIEDLFTSLRTKAIDETTAITLSMGISSYKKSDTLSTLFQRADQALYHSKNQGRNQYTISH